jgi:hypothetical protein
MKVFHCGHCGQVIYFENTQCVRCGRSLAYVPDVGAMQSLDPVAGDTWSINTAGGEYRLCRNYSENNVCNWAVPVDDPNTLCRSCRLTRTLPDLNGPGHFDAWFRLELAKRRVIFGLVTLGLPIISGFDDPENGLLFDFLSSRDPVPGESPVRTGHESGVITVNIAEADDAERERVRLALGEPYRTLVGHFRHEIGHYFWDRLVAGGGRLEQFRALFGDESQNYRQALIDYYAHGPAADWMGHCVTAYASSHPWEDWAETWAHYLHMMDGLETAGACGLLVAPRRADEPHLTFDTELFGPGAQFDRLVEQWFTVTYVLNNLNRAMGQQDAYPFVLSPQATNKLRFVHESILAWSSAGAERFAAV